MYHIFSVIKRIDRRERKHIRSGAAQHKL